MPLFLQNVVGTVRLDGHPVEGSLVPVNDNALLELGPGAGLTVIKVETVAVVRSESTTKRPILESHFPPSSFLLQDCGNEMLPPHSILQTDAGRLRVVTNPSPIGKSEI